MENFMTKGAKLSLLVISLTILLMAALMSGTIKSDHWKVTNIELGAEFKRVTSEQIRIAVAAYPERSFFKIKAEEIRNTLKNIPWVEKVTVNKKWPNSLIIKLIEHKAVAVWNDNQLLNDKGEIFNVDGIDDLAALPKISGHDAQSGPIWDNYIRYSEIVKQTGYDISETTVSKRGGWDIFLSNGLNIRLGSQQIDARLVRLVDTWAKLTELKEELPEYIDLRYTNGYAIKWNKRVHESLTHKKLLNTRENGDSGNTNG